ncbi:MULTISPECIES: DUF7127 family protein [Haloarcula]|uniref:Hsp20/alpha crystallin family protein n=1 Tax=Haloarcula pellucida TaxID=1427151 RepID=A0A830GML1_9EURY|nr:MULTISPECIES: hypothetical protein [Halomicroarcula]MBX0348384.1 hypothetical protein [Halomicroarcula pellucida]MDS0278206.1 hypothetical protein [Halomicroarcula sp. S1AR25-4]QIO23857.1 hypothetical protein G9465_16485 [Haloarcula sp. JP-L23]GGN93616.1 hypothetical protein GCM10009030_19240 [Halomicroarcula pellucida]
MDATHDADELDVSRSEHDDGWTVAVDLHPVDDDAVTVELLGDTAVVAVDTALYHTEYDVSLPAADGTASLNNGVLVVSGDA